MNKLFSLLIATCFYSLAFAQQKKIKTIEPSLPKTKLVVGLIVDQMRWDFLYIYRDRYGKGGFNRLLKDGFTAENLMLDYTPTFTGCGHASIYTGSVPGINGIVGNSWYDKELEKNIYCTEDLTVHGLGMDIKNSEGKMSPRNMLTTTIGDQIRISTNFRGKSIGVALKDRASILPAGHSANAAYWYVSKSEGFITSTYYMKELPNWVKKFNARKIPDSLMSLGWKTLYPIETYKQSTSDEKNYEGKLGGTKRNSFPYNFNDSAVDKKSLIKTTPYGNEYTLMFAKEALLNEELGKDNDVDLLAVSLSSPDYIGHTFGPNSIEQEDNILRVDKQIEDFLNFLDKNVGKENYVIFVTADHGVAHIPGYSKEYKLPGGFFEDDSLRDKLNSMIEEKFGIKKMVLNTYNYQVAFNERLVDNKKLKEIITFVLPTIRNMEGVYDAFDIDELQTTNINYTIKKSLTNGYYRPRCGHIQIVLKPGYMENFANGIGTTHGVWNPYDSHIPFMLMGNGIKKGKSYRLISGTDIVATIAALLQIQMPDGCIGAPIYEAINH